mmetsp:Transcript_35566/g.32050  ORF Transcript_35566/g.32050 Transcript_35566/m.32050 type:complete len:292 (+) Transcript_35566:118-993(+)
MVRWIFEGNTKFTEYEEQQIKEFYKHLEKKFIAFPQEWLSVKHNSLKFLHANQWNFDKAVKTIQEYLDWRKKNLPVNINGKIHDFLDSGIIYVHGRDNRFRPILVLNTYKLDPKNVNLETTLESITYFLTYVIENLLLPGQVENWVIIQDMGKMGITELPLKMLKTVMDFLQNNFRARLYKMYAVNAPSTIYWGFKLVKPLLEETTANKIHFTKEGVNEEMWTHINKTQVEKRFGGNAENNEKFWPPQFPSEQYFLENEKPEDFLVSKDEYKKRYQEGQLTGKKVDPSIAS